MTIFVNRREQSVILLYGKTSVIRLKMKSGKLFRDDDEDYKTAIAYEQY